MEWTLLGLGCCLAAGVLVAAAARRRRRAESARAMPPHLRAFLIALSSALADQRASLAGFVPGRWTVIVELEGQETPVPIPPLIEHWTAFPGDLQVLVRRLLNEIREDGLDDLWDVSFSDAAADVLPQVRTMDWVRQNGPAFGDGRIVHRNLGADLAVCYVIDDSWSMVFVCEGHLRHWNREETDLFSLARQNLIRRTEAPVANRLLRGEPTVHRAGDGYAAARVLLLDVDESAGDLLVALPDRDTLWVGTSPDSPRALDELMAQNSEECDHASRPVSPKLYRWAGTELAEVMA